MLERIKIILVGTSHPGNIGSAARAMKTMGLTELVLVAPQKFPHQHAIEMASGAVEILEEAQVVETLEEALADTHLVIGSSARRREIVLPMLTMDEFAPYIAKQSSDSKIAIVFGRERTGLTNQELAQCSMHVMVETNPDYSSLNLAQAVQLFCYEIRKCYLNNNATSVDVSDDKVKMASTSEIEGFYHHLEKTLMLTEFLDLKQPNKVMAKLKRLFKRANLEESDVNILRGVLSSIQKTHKVD